MNLEDFAIECFSASQAVVVKRRLESMGHNVFRADDMPYSAFRYLTYSEGKWVACAREYRGLQDKKYIVKAEELGL